MINNFMGFSSVDDRLNKKENQVPLRVEIACSVDDVDSVHGVEPESEFKPIDHPLEPSDEDYPVKCPVPESSILNDGAMQERFTESMRRRGELPSVDDEDMMAASMEPPAQAVRKRQHTITFDHTTPLFQGLSLPPLPNHSESNTTILQVLQHRNEFKPSQNLV